MVIAKKFILEKYFEGKPKRSDLKLVEEELPSLQDGGTHFFIFIPFTTRQVFNLKLLNLEFTIFSC